jgi:hypothetical protein
VTTDGHLDTGLLDRYAHGHLGAPALWSVEAHLGACARCREALALAAGPDVDRNWQRIDVAIDLPRPGPVERILLLARVPEHIARLLAATPALRLSWLGAVAGMLTLGVLTEWLSTSLRTPLPLLATVPLMAVAGTCVAYGPGVDPTYEIGLVAPFHTFRLALLRTAAVLLVTLGLAGAATLAVPDAGLRAAAWLAPALLLTVTSLGLSPALGPVRAALAVTVAWIAALIITVRLPSGTSVLFEPAAQLGIAGATGLAALAVAGYRRQFETHQNFRPLTAFRRSFR